MKKIPYGRQTIDESDIAAVTDVLRSERITQGPVVDEFERALAKRCGARFAVVSSSGTAALHLAYMALGLGPGSTVVTSPMTFVATPNAALFCGARVLFADIDPATVNLDPDSLSRALLDNGEEGLDGGGAVVPVHYAGTAAKMGPIRTLADTYGLNVIEDGCHSLGTTWIDESGVERKVGDCAYSDMTVFSFHPVKSITTGEGGAITTNDPELYERIRLLRSHAITRNPEYFVFSDITGTKEPAPWYYEMQGLSNNYRITDMQCALGLSQLSRLDSFMERRAGIAALYDRLFEGSRFVRTLARANGHASAHHLYPVMIDFEKFGIDKGEWFSLMADRGIEMQVHYIPVHLQPFYRANFGYKEGDFKEAEAYYKSAASLPIYPLLTDEDVEFVVTTLNETLEGLCGDRS